MSLFMLCSKSNQWLVLLDVFRIQIPRRAGIAAETVVHVFAFHFEGEEDVFVGGVRVHAEFGEITEKTFAGATYVTGVGEGVFGLGKESLDFVSGEFGHDSISFSLSFSWHVLVY